ncbi:M28 family metallopeptidase [Luteimonas sp. MJ250]|uniref:M28 family metallopeptidase n=1 Tax=Luteimonas sp. MJ250 TaxID=3129236 RepID=UPI0031BAB5BE
MRPTHLVLSLAVATALAACGNGEPAAAAAAANTGDAPAATASTHAFSPELSKDDFAEMVKTLSSDEFQGRAPGSPGGEMTVEYIKAQYERIGLEPGGDDGSFFQTVPMVETTADESTVLHMEVAGEPRELAFGTDMVIGTRTGEAEVKVADSDLVFVGYGVDAPELGWNDYAGIDVTGKTVVILVNDPGFHAKDDSLFEGERMTYYGRWTYKFEEAARKGAAAALIIHDTAGASYGWDVVKNSWSGPQFDLRASDDPEPRLPAQGWLSAEAATQLFAGAGQDLEALYTAANQRGFIAVPLDARVSFDLASTTRESSSRNVIGVLRGSEAPDEAVVYMGHWDHLGTHEGEGDQIYNGAIDNATGIAGIVEIAEKFKADGQPKRSIAFVAVTLEESGLLGSKYQVAHPVFPLENTVAVINLDAMSVAGPSRDMVVVGQGNSELEDVLKTFTDGQERVIVAEGNPAGGFFFRSDHFNYAKAGVPALYAKGGDDLLDGGKDAGAEHARHYTEVAYHKPADEFDPAWNLDGVIQDLEVLYGVGRTLADDGSWPNWYEGNAFKAARDGMRPGAK